MKVTLLVPTLNEIVGMKTMMPKVNPSWVDQILVVDGGSNDGTVEYARSCGYDVHVQRKKGIRYAYIEALEHTKGDYWITFSPDGNSIPEAIPHLISKIKAGYDMVIASRYLTGAKSFDDDFLTGFGNGFFTSLINRLHGGHYTDAMVMYRIYPIQLFKDLKLDRDESYRIEERLLRTVVGCEPLLSVRAAKRKYKISEIPFDEPLRIGGKRKLKIIQWGLAYLFEVIREKFTE